MDEDVMAGPAPGIDSIVNSIATGERSCLEITEEFLAAADVSNAEINAFVTRTGKEARAAARRVDAGDPGASPLLGVPFTVKDTIQTGAVRTTAGSLLLADHIPDSDAVAVARLKRAGAIMVGKTSCPEFAMDIHTANRVVGATRNPLDPTRTSGGSSGGDSAAVAAGFAAFGLGSDYGGSIRWPAHCTGLAAIRPTPGLIPSNGLLPNASPDPGKPPNSLSVRGLFHTLAPIARTVADLQRVLPVLAGTPLPDVRAGTGRPAVAWSQGDNRISVRSDVVEAVASVADRLARSGLRVERRSPRRVEAAAEMLGALRDVDGLADVERLAQRRRQLLSPTSIARLEAMRDVSVREFQDLAMERDALREDALAFLEDWPIWILPVATIPAFELDADDPTAAQPAFVVDGARQARYEVMAPCWAVALYGFPSAVVPCGHSREGLPIGLQVVGRPHADMEVLAFAARIEALVEEEWSELDAR
jgi:Asp-tRNA(Asn)/Glu-tRNA(Gln) amidotransferase A subunit family amidase